MRVRHTQPARAQIHHALARLYADSPTAAANLALRIEKAEELLGRYPNIGRASTRPNMPEGTRELVIAGTRYILVYRVYATYVEILDLRHSARKP